MAKQPVRKIIKIKPFKARRIKIKIPAIKKYSVSKFKVVKKKYGI